MVGESASLSLAVMPVTVSPVKLYPSLSMVECFCALWNETLVQLFIAFYASKMCLYFIKNKFLCFLSLLRLSVTFINQLMHSIITAVDVKILLYKSLKDSH